jgi:hypothetical protein
MPIIELSSMCMTADNCRNKIESGKKIASANGFDFGVQIHNSVGKDLYDEIMKNSGGIELSVHSPVFMSHFINLASPDFEFAHKQCEENVARLKMLGTDILFFHGFFMTQKPLVHDMKNYRRTMAAGIGEEFCLNGTFIMNPLLFESEIYKSYLNTFAANLLKMKSLFPDMQLALENDFVGIGSGLQRPQEIHEFVDPLWFDLGHFWCASLLHGFDYYEECGKIAEEKTIVGVHINHNFMTADTPKEKLSDSHAHIYEKSEQNLGPVIQQLLDRGTERFTLEIVDGNEKDMETFFSWL